MLRISRFLRLPALTAALVLLMLPAAPSDEKASPGAAKAAIGKAAPDFALPDVDGKTVRLSEFKGKIVVLEWFNLGCPFVRKHYDSGAMQKLQSDVTGQGGVWLSICSSAPGKQGHYAAAEMKAATAREKAASTAVLLDPQGEVGRLYGAKTTPHMFVIAQDGVLVYDGAIDNIKSTDVADVPKAENYVRAAVDQTRAGKPVAKPTTPPYGCSVKY